MRVTRRGVDSATQRAPLDCRGQGARTLARFCRCPPRGALGLVERRRPHRVSERRRVRWCAGCVRRGPVRWRTAGGARQRSAPHAWRASLNRRSAARRGSRGPVWLLPRPPPPPPPVRVCAGRRPSRAVTARARGRRQGVRSGARRCASRGSARQPCPSFDLTWPLRWFRPMAACRGWSSWRWSSKTSSRTRACSAWDPSTRCVGARDGPRRCVCVALRYGCNGAILARPRSRGHVSRAAPRAFSPAGPPIPDEARAVARRKNGGGAGGDPPRSAGRIRTPAQRGEGWASRVGVHASAHVCGGA